MRLPVIAGTNTIAASRPAGTQVFVPSSTHVEPFLRAVVAGDCAGALSSTSAVVAIGLAGDESGKPRALQRVVTETGDGQYAHHDRGEIRHLRDGAADFFEHERNLEEPETRTAVGFGCRDTEQAGVGQRGPRLAIEPLAVGFELFVAIGRDEIGEDLPRQTNVWFLVLRSVRNPSMSPHRSDRGMPKPNIAIRSRWSSLVPPPNVKINNPR